MTLRFSEQVKKENLILDANTKWIPNNIQFEVIMGSQAYGVSQDNSDEDIYGWCIPRKEVIFPHLSGHIHNFGPNPETFNMFQRHHVNDENSGKEYDFNIYNVVKFVSLVCDNNPNMIDALFVPDNCITHMTQTGQILRDERHSFLHKGSWHRFRGYAYSQIHKLKTKESSDGMKSKRRDLIEKYGYDVKFASHAIRLLDECEQILSYKDIDLQRDKERIKEIRRGEWSYEQIMKFFDDQVSRLETAYEKSTIPYTIDWVWAKQILMNILEQHYGSISKSINMDRTSTIINEIEGVLQKYR